MLTSRPLRALLRDLCVFRRPKLHRLSLALSRWFKRREPKDIRQVREDAAANLPLCVLCGLRFAIFAFSADPSYIVSLSLAFSRWFKRKGRKGFSQRSQRRCRADLPADCNRLGSIGANIYETQLSCGWSGKAYPTAMGRKPGPRMTLRIGLPNT